MTFRDVEALVYGKEIKSWVMKPGGTWRDKATNPVGAFFQVGTTALASAAANSSFILFFPFVF